MDVAGHQRGAYPFVRAVYCLYCPASKVGAFGKVVGTFLLLYKVLLYVQEGTSPVVLTTLPVALAGPVLRGRCLARQFSTGEAELWQLLPGKA